MTNTEKFTEVFGFTPMDNCIAPFEECEQYKYCDNRYDQCPYKGWWNREFEDKKEEQNNECI